MYANFSHALISNVSNVFLIAISDIFLEYINIIHEWEINDFFDIISLKLFIFSLEKKIDPKSCLKSLLSKRNGIKMRDILYMYSDIMCNIYRTFLENILESLFKRRERHYNCRYFYRIYLRQVLYEEKITFQLLKLISDALKHICVAILN